VLVGDDDVNDRFFMEWGFKEVCPGVRVDFARNGEEVIQFLEDTGASEAISFLILDSMMPKSRWFGRCRLDALETGVRRCSNSHAFLGNSTNEMLPKQGAGKLMRMLKSRKTSLS